MFGAKDDDPNGIYQMKLCHRQRVCFTGFVPPDCFSSENMDSYEFCVRDRKPELNFRTYLGL